MVASGSKIMAHGATVARINYHIMETGITESLEADGGNKGILRETASLNLGVFVRQWLALTQKYNAESGSHSRSRTVFLTP